MGRIAAWGLTFALVLGGVGQAEAQGAGDAVVAQPETSVGVVLRNLAARAGVVFVGQVVRIERTAGTVEIVFQVQQPVLGTVGATYTLREWSGLWAGGQQRYRLGERAMVFLHTPKAGAGNGGGSGAGLSSAVDGMEGVVPVVVQGANAAALLDVRWLAARVLRAEGAPLADAEDGAITLADGVAVAAGWKNSELQEPVERPLPVGVRPVQALPGPLPTGPRPAPPETGVASLGPQGTGSQGMESQGLGAETLGTKPMPPIVTVKVNGVQDRMRAAAPGGLDADR